MNSSCPMGTFDQGPIDIPWTIHESNLFFRTTVGISLKNPGDFKKLRIALIHY